MICKAAAQRHLRVIAKGFKRNIDDGIGNQRIYDLFR